MHCDEGGVGIFGFTVSAIFKVGFSVFAPKNFGFSVLVSVAVCGFSSFEHLVFGFQPECKRIHVFLRFSLIGKQGP